MRRGRGAHRPVDVDPVEPDRGDDAALAARNCQYATFQDAIAVRDRIVAAAERLSGSLSPPELVPTPDVLRDEDGVSPWRCQPELAPVGRLDPAPPKSSRSTPVIAE